MTFSDEVERRRAELAVADARTAAEGTSAPFYGAEGRFRAVRPETIDGAGWLVEVVHQLVQYPQAFAFTCFASAQPDGSYDCLDWMTWAALGEQRLANTWSERRAERAQAKGIKRSLKKGELVEIGTCMLGGSWVLANGLVESTVDLSTEAAIRNDAVEMIAQASH